MNAEVQNIPVFFVTNTDMVGYTATTMVSVAVNTKHDVSFYIMDCGLSEFDRKQFQSLKDAFSNIKNIEFRSVDLKRFEGLSVWYHGLLDAWTMLLFPESFPEVNKGVHIESDTIVLDDIAKLYNVDLEGFTVAACPDIAATLRPEIDLDLHKHIYFNLGMIVIDFVKWRKENITEKSIALGKKYGKKFFCLHQDALNILFSDNRYKILPNRYNLGERKNEIKQIHPEYSDEYFKNEWKHPVIIHFSPNKPWRTPSSFYSVRRVKYFEEWWHYASMTPYYQGLQNAFIAQRIKDEIKGLLAGFDNYGNSLLDTLPEGHPARNIIGENKILINNQVVDLASSNQEAGQSGERDVPCLRKCQRYRLLGIPVLKVKISDSGSMYYRLFNHIPLMKLEKRENGTSISYKLFDVVPLLKIKK